MALDAAVFEPTSGFVFGVRGQWIYKFSASDGGLISSARFSPNSVDRSYITALGGKLYCSTTVVPYNAIPFDNFAPGDVYSINATTLVATALLVKTQTATTYATGYGPIANDGANIGVIELVYDNLGHTHQNLIIFPPANVPAFNRSANGGSVWRDLTYDPVRAGWWCIDPSIQNVFFIPSADINTGAFNSGSPANVGSGVTYNQATDKTYMVNGTEELVVTPACSTFIMPPAYNAFALTTLHTARINANPFRVKSCNNLVGNPFNGKVLIPAWFDDTVLVWNPATDNVANMVVKTGFTAPVDIVHCPTASYAVQNSTVGLKKIV